MDLVHSSLKLRESCLKLRENPDRAIFQNLADRNARVQRPRYSERTEESTPRQRIIRVLDSNQPAHDISSISTACRNATEDKTVLIFSVLEWCATPFRTGLRRVYTCVRLLRKWKMSIDVDPYILAFLTEASSRATLNMDNIYHVVSELVRSQTFSVGRYLQWLMARGVLDKSGQSVSVPNPYDVFSNVTGRVK